MATKALRKNSASARRTRRPTAVMSPEARAAYGELRQGVAHLERSIAQIQRGVRKAERKIEADARARVRELRRDVQAQLGTLRTKRHETARSLKELSAAVGDSWRDVKRSADEILGSARGTADAVVERFRRATHG